MFRQLFLWRRVDPSDHVRWLDTAVWQNEHQGLTHSLARTQGRFSARPLSTAEPNRTVGIPNVLLRPL